MTRPSALNPASGPARGSAATPGRPPAGTSAGGVGPDRAGSGGVSPAHNRAADPSPTGPSPTGPSPAGSEAGRDDAATAAVSAAWAALTARANALALAYQQGDTEALPALVEILQPLLHAALRRYTGGSLILPAALDMEDLRQQSWLIIATRARRWDPSEGDFPAYVRTTFLWEIWRYVRSLSPGRRSRSVRVDNVPHDVLIERLSDQAGTDGRRWDDQIVATEMLRSLDPIARWSFVLHQLEERSFQDVAQALRLTQAGVYRAYRRALDQLRLRAGLELDPDDALARQPGGRPAVERLVAALHEAAGPGGRVPGRAVVCALANLSEVRFARLMGLLVIRGCVVERSARKPGRLVYATAEETLAQLLRRPDAET